MAMFPYPICHPSGWPRISELPENERQAFEDELYGQTVPYVEGEATQDFFYPWDYLRWKAGRENDVDFD